MNNYSYLLIVLITEKLNFPKITCMSIRPQAIQWYVRKYNITDDTIYSSKLYKPQESWTATKIWWVQIPIKKIQENPNMQFHILCQKEIDPDDFYHLQIPATYFHENMRKFHIVENSLSIYLSPDPNSFLIEKRGGFNLNFNSFLINPD